jgi:hypothetical protein
MAKTCGIRLGSRRAEIVVLDGSAKKPKLRLYAAAVLPTEATGTEEEWGALLAELAKGATDGVASEDVGLVIDSGLAVYRHLSLPFAERQKIEEVLKFEVESKIPQWNIDDVVCDFHVVSGTPVESHLLVSALPKDLLTARIAACTRAGLEPYEAELDATALFLAAESAGLLIAEKSQLLVFLGEASATFVVVSDGKLLSTRAFHFEVDTGAARVATAAVDASGKDGGFERRDDEDLLGAQRERRRIHVTRLKREIARTISSASTGFGFVQVLVSGTAAGDLLGEPIAGVEVLALDPFADVAGAEAIEDRLGAVVVYGAALRRLGPDTAVKPHLRREELAYAGTFERLELPLGVFALMLALFFGVKWFIAQQSAGMEQLKLDFYARELKTDVLGNDPERGDVAGAALLDPPEAVKSYLLGMAQGDEVDASRSRFEEMQQLQLLIVDEIDTLKERLGAAENTSYPQSALWAAQLPLDLIDRLSKDKRLPRHALRGIEAEYQRGNATRPDRCEVSLNLTIWGETSVQSAEAYDTLVNELRAQDWLVNPDELREPQRKTGGDGNSLILENLRFFVNPDAASARYLTVAPNAAAAATSEKEGG